MLLVRNLKKRHKKGKIPQPEEMAGILAHVFDQTANRRAFKIFRDKKFRQLIKFNKLQQVEQDRIFNELVLAGIVLIMLTLESPDLRIKNEFKEYFDFVREKIPEAHLGYLKELGIERKHRRLWKKLINMRYNEYYDNRLKTREAAISMESKEEEMTIKKLEDIQLTLPVNTVAIGCHHHICRGKTKGKDELFKLILRWLSKMYVEIRVPLEGGKINLLTKTLVKARRFLNFLNK